MFKESQGSILSEKIDLVEAKTTILMYDVFQNEIHERYAHLIGDELRQSLKEIIEKYLRLSGSSLLSSKRSKKR